MIKLISAMLILLSAQAEAVVSISPLTPVYSAGQNMTIQRGTNSSGQDVVFLYWQTFGLFSVVKHCSITTVVEFLDNINTRKSVVEAVYLLTPAGALWEWAGPPPANLNPWCLQ
jgi:hypothetical protein